MMNCKYVIAIFFIMNLSQPIFSFDENSFSGAIKAHMHSLSSSIKESFQSERTFQYAMNSYYNESDFSGIVQKEVKFVNEPNTRLVLIQKALGKTEPTLADQQPNKSRIISKKKIMAKNEKLPETKWADYATPKILIGGSMVIVCIGAGYLFFTK